MKPSWTSISYIDLKRNSAVESQSVGRIRSFLIITKFLLNSNYYRKYWVLKTNNETFC